LEELAEVDIGISIGSDTIGIAENNGRGRNILDCENKLVIESVCADVF